MKEHCKCAFKDMASLVMDSSSVVAKLIHVVDEEASLMEINLH